jgi:hypothetical protein
MGDPDTALDADLPLWMFRVIHMVRNLVRLGDPERMQRIHEDLADRARWQDLGDDMPGQEGELTCRICGEEWTHSALQDECAERVQRQLVVDGHSPAELLDVVAEDFRARGCRALELAFGTSTWCMGAATDRAAHSQGLRRRPGTSTAGRRPAQRPVEPQ